MQPAASRARCGIKQQNKTIKSNVKAKQAGCFSDKLLEEDLIPVDVSRSSYRNNLPSRLQNNQ